MNPRGLLLQAFFVFQTVSLLTETLQEGLIDLAFNAINIGFLALFVAMRPRDAGQVAPELTAIGRFFVLWLAIPAAISLAFSGETSQAVGLARIAIWIEVLLFSLVWHDREERIDATMRLLRRCGFVVVAAFVAFNVQRVGETAYGLEVIHLGTAESLPAVSMFALALMMPFLAPGPRGWRLIGYAALLILVVLLFKRSAILGALLVTLVGIRYLGLRLPFARSALVIGGLTVLFVSFASIVGLAKSNALIAARFGDFEKVAARQDLAYIGSGRMGLTVRWWEEYAHSGPGEKLFGQMVDSADQVIGDRYLGKTWPAPHNDLLDILLRGGAIGLLHYLLLLAALAARLFVTGRKPGSDAARAWVTIGQLAFVVYALHIVIGVVTKVQLMAVTAVLIGIAIRARTAMSSTSLQADCNDFIQSRPQAVAGPAASPAVRDPRPYLP